MAASTTSRKAVLMVEASSTFKETAEAWLVWAQKRNRKPMRPGTVPSVRSALDKWILPAIGNLPLAKVHSGSVKHLVSAMRDAGLSPKSIQTYTNLVKSIVASVLDEESGEPVFPRKWSPVILDLPVIETQKQPCLTRDEVEHLLMMSTDWERMLYLLLAATGLRIREALALETQDVINGGRSLRICQQVNRFGKIVRYTKTRAGTREVDLHSDVTDQLLAFAGGKNGLLFPSQEGTPRCADNVRIRRLEKHSKKGWHSFRRFRNSHLRSPKVNCQQDMLIFWLGHKPESMSEIYSKLREMREERLAEAERVGVGFDAQVSTRFVKRGHKWYPTEAFGSAKQSVSRS